MNYMKDITNSLPIKDEPNTPWSNFDYWFGRLRDFAAGVGFTAFMAFVGWWVAK